MYTLGSCGIKLTSSTGEVITVNAAAVVVELVQDVFEHRTRFDNVVDHYTVLDRELVIRCKNGQLSVDTPRVHPARKEGIRVIRFGRSNEKSEEQEGQAA